MRNFVFWLSALAIFMFPSEDMLKTDEYGSAAKAIGISLAGLWVFVVLVTGTIRRFHAMHALAILFLLWNVVSVLWSVDPERTMERMETYVQMIGLFALLWDLYQSPHSLRIALQAYILGTYIPIVSMLHNFANGVQVHEFAHGRYAPAGGHPNGTGLVLAISLPIAWYLASTAPESRWSSRWRLFNYCHIPLAFFCILLTASRGSLLATAPAIGLVLISLGRHRLGHMLAALTFIVVGGLALFPLVPEESLNRLGTTKDQIEDANLNGRVAIWTQGIDKLLEHPFTGVGANAYPAAIEMGRAPHNTALSVIVDTGIIGFLLFASMIGLACLETTKMMSNERWFWLAVMAVWLIGAMCHNWEHTKHTWLLLSLLTIGGSVCPRREDSWSFGSDAGLAFPQPPSLGRAGA